GMKRRLEAVQERGGTVVVIDPRKTETAAMANRHVFIRPGTDAALLLVLLQLALADARADCGDVAHYVDGLRALKDVADGIDIDDVARFTGVSADDIRDIWRTLIANGPSVIYGRIGACTQEFGGLCAWLVLVLNVVAGNLDRRG